MLGAQVLVDDVLLMNARQLLKQLVGNVAQLSVRKVIPDVDQVIQIVPGSELQQFGYNINSVG